MCALHVPQRGITLVVTLLVNQLQERTPGKATHEQHALGSVTSR